MTALMINGRFGKVGLRVGIFCIKSHQETVSGQACNPPDPH
jgi:hypothetical protein